jgi:hypothetical protein
MNPPHNKITLTIIKLHFIIIIILRIQFFIFQKKLQNIIVVIIIYLLTQTCQHAHGDVKHEIN